MAASEEVSSTSDSTENEETNVGDHDSMGIFDAAMMQLKQTFQDCGYT